MVADGKLIAEKSGKKVYEFSTGDYFGEISLVRNTPRQATVKCVTKTQVVCIDRDSFKRMFGPIEEILKRNEEKYKKFITDWPIIARKPLFFKISSSSIKLIKSYGESLIKHIYFCHFGSSLELMAIIYFKALVLLCWIISEVFWKFSLQATPIESKDFHSSFWGKILSSPPLFGKIANNKYLEWGS